MVLSETNQGVQRPTFTKQPRVIFIEYKSDVIINIIFISPGSKGLIKGKFQAVMFKQTVWYFSNVLVLSPVHVLVWLMLCWFPNQNQWETTQKSHADLVTQDLVPATMAQSINTEQPKQIGQVKQIDYTNASSGTNSFPEYLIFHLMLK